MVISKICTRIIIICGIVFFSILTVCSLLFTTVLENGYSGDLVVCFNPSPIIGILITIVLLILPPVKNFLSRLDYHVFARFVFLWGLCISLLWIFIANVLPMWDSMDLISAANLLNGTPDQFSMANWSKGWYLERYPYQLPIVLLITACMKVAGSNFVIFFEVINCFACALTMYLVIKLTHELFHRNYITILSGLLAMSFVPIVLYCTFVYGNIICLPFVLAGILFQKRAMDISNNFKKAILLAILSSILLAFSAFIKSSMSIFLIASLVGWFIWCFENRRYAFLIIAIAPFIILKLLTFTTNSLVSSKIDINLNNGAPKLTWVVMGIGGGREYAADQNNDHSISNSLANPGYYDGFAWVTSAEEYSPDRVSEISTVYLEKRLKHFVSEPNFMAAFFTKKFLLEWTEPTFEGFLASNWPVTSPSTGYNMAERDYTFLAPSIYYGKIHSVLFYFMDVVQSLLPVFSLIALISLRKKLSIQKILPIVCVLGGALLYLIWENKTQYMFTFYLIMIPFASLGIFQITTKYFPNLLRKIKHT